MTKQEVFDIVAKHLLTQNVKAWENGFCRYKTSTGLKCAVGCLIPDGHPAQSNGGSVGSLLRDFGCYSVDDRKNDTTLQTLKEHECMLNILQCIHDTGEPSTWRGRLREYGSSWNLSTEVLDV